MRVLLLRSPYPGSPLVLGMAGGEGPDYLGYVQIQTQPSLASTSAQVSPRKPMKFARTLFLTAIAYITAATAQTHPRLFFDAAELTQIRTKLDREPFKTMLATLEATKSFYSLTGIEQHAVDCVTHHGGSIYSNVSFFEMDDGIGFVRCPASS